MGIAVISGASLSTPGTGAGTQLPIDGGGADFAALLTQQLSIPQLFGSNLQAAAGFEAAKNSDDRPTDSTPEGSAGSLDLGAMLATAGLLPPFTLPAKPVQTEATPILAEKAADQAPMAGIIGRLELGDGKGRRMEAANAGEQGDPLSSAGRITGGETANIAVETQPGAGASPNFAATLAAQAQSAQPIQPRGQSPAATPQISTPLHDSRWSQDFGEKIVWLAKNDQQVAQININPPQLGPMQITLNVNGDLASALFVSPHAEVRQAIQDAMPQLREMLAGAGINLGQANVGAQLSQQHNGSASSGSAPSRPGDDNDILRADHGQDSILPLSAVRSGRGMVDLFA